MNEIDNLCARAVEVANLLTMNAKLAGYASYGQMLEKAVEAVKKRRDMKVYVIVEGSALKEVLSDSPKVEVIAYDLDIDPVDEEIASLMEEVLEGNLHKVGP